jgi:hypothetical protein
MVVQCAYSYKSDSIPKAKKTNHNTYMFTILFSSFPNQNTSVTKNYNTYL